jgi:hypothetical protein
MEIILMTSLIAFSCVLLALGTIALIDAVNIKNNTLPDLLKITANESNTISNACMSCNLDSGELTFLWDLRNEIPGIAGFAPQFQSGQLEIGNTELGYGPEGASTISPSVTEVRGYTHVTPTGALIFGKCSEFNGACSDVDTEKYQGSYGIAAQYSPKTPRASRCVSAPSATIYQVIETADATPDKFYICACYSNVEYCTEELISDFIDWTPT